MAIPGGMMDRVIQARKQQPGYNPNILGPLGQLMTGVGNLIQGRPYGTSFTGVGNIPPSARGESYRRAELRLANAARPGGGGGNAGYSVSTFTSPAADRAYEAEKSRVAQLTAQDPELQRYKKASKDAKTQEEMNAARDIGMQIWQQKYGSTPMGQPGGAVGMDNPLMLKTFGYQSGSAPGQQMGAPTQGPTPNIPQVDQSLNPASPTFLGGEGAPLMNFADENLTPEMIEAYQKQLLGQAAARK